MPWTLKPNNLEGDYSFSGKFLATRNLMDTIGPDVVMHMYLVIQYYVEREGSIGQCQVFENTENKRKIYFIDQLSDTVKSTRELTQEQLKEEDYCTAMFAEEY